MTKKLTATQTLKVLKTELPFCFKKGAAKLPLALNIHEDILRHYANDTRFDEKTLTQAIKFYTQSTHYLKKIKAGVCRIEINGQAQTVIKNFEQKYAENILKKRSCKLM